VASRASHSLTSIDVSVMSSPKILAILKDSVKLNRAEHYQGSYQMKNSCINRVTLTPWTRYTFPFPIQ
jgi:hypothetical protein